MISPLTDRISLLELVNSRFPNGVGVEIGVAGGHFTKQILATWKTMGKLYIVDPWKHFKEGYDDPCNLSDKEQEGRYQQVKKDFALESRIEIMRMMSHEASREFGPKTVDFLYLDGNHSFAETMRDETCWWPVLKPGGIFAGHDYMPGNGKGYGVKDAVDTFAKDHGLIVHKTTQEFCRPEGVYGAGWEGFSFVLEKPV